MAGKRDKPEGIVVKLREAEVLQRQRQEAAAIISVDFLRNVSRVHGVAADAPAVYREKLSLPQCIRFATSRD